MTTTIRNHRSPRAERMPDTLDIPALSDTPVKLGASLASLVEKFGRVRSVNDAGGSATQFVLEPNKAGGTSAWVTVSSPAAVALRKSLGAGQKPPLAKVLALAAKAPQNTLLTTDIATSPMPGYVRVNRYTVAFDEALKATWLQARGDDGEAEVASRANTHFQADAFVGARSFDNRGGKAIGVRDLDGDGFVGKGERREAPVNVSERDLWLVKVD